MINSISFNCKDSCAVLVLLQENKLLRELGKKIKNKKTIFQKVYITYIYVRITIVSSLHIKAVFFIS